MLVSIRTPLAVFDFLLRPELKSSGAVMTPISLATTFVQRSPGEHTVPSKSSLLFFFMMRDMNTLARVIPREMRWKIVLPPSKTRSGVQCLLLSGRFLNAGAAFASGSAATGSLVQLLKSGDEVIAYDDLYGGSYRYFTKLCGTY